MNIQGDDFMRKDYNTVVDISLVEEKHYLLNLCLTKRIQYSLYQCFSIKQINKIINQSQINNTLYKQALIMLYQSKDFEALEKQLIFMNKYFDNQDYKDLKKDLFQKISQKNITIQEYCVLRHLISFEKISFEYFIEKLHFNYGVSHLECAKICLIENHSHLAYKYLKQLNHCQDQNILQLLDIKDYLLLKNDYQEKKNKYILLSAH